MKEQERFDIISRIKRKMEIKKANMLTVYCLIATMTDRKLLEFEKEVLVTNDEPYTEDFKYNPN